MNTAAAIFIWFGIGGVLWGYLLWRRRREREAADEHIKLIKQVLKHSFPKIENNT